MYWYPEIVEEQQKPCSARWWAADAFPAMWRRVLPEQRLAQQEKDACAVAELKLAKKVRCPSPNRCLTKYPVIHSQQCKICWSCEFARD